MHETLDKNYVIYCVESTIDTIVYNSIIENSDVKSLEEQQKVYHSDDCTMQNLPSPMGKQTETISPGVNLQKQKEERPLKSEEPSLKNLNTHKKVVLDKKHDNGYTTK
jgi:hypothetical protein